MRTITWLAFYFLLFPVQSSSSVFRFMVHDFQGKLVDLKKFQGKKIVFVSVDSESVVKWAEALSVIQTQFDKSVTVIALPMEVSKTENAGIGGCLDRLNPHFILLQGCNVSSSVKDGKEDLIKWLTQKSLNGRFEVLDLKPGYKFFIDETGELYSVLSPEVPLSGAFVHRVLSRSLPLNK